MIFWFLIVLLPCYLAFQLVEELIRQHEERRRPIVSAAVTGRANRPNSEKEYSKT